MKLSQSCLYKLAEVVFAKPQGDSSEIYLTGSQLVDSFNSLGFVDDLYANGIVAEGFDIDFKPSRKEYVKKRLTILNEQSQIEKTLVFFIQNSVNPTLFYNEVNKVLVIFGMNLEADGTLVVTKPLLNGRLPINPVLASNNISESVAKAKKKIFISYSWDSDEHKKWVHTLADRLRPHFDVKIDVKQPYGTELNMFMEKMVSESDRVLIILTPTYKSKADKRENGVGYESVLISDELFKDQNTIKFVPIIRKGTKKECYPLYLGNRKGVLMTDDNAFDDVVEELINDILEN